MDHPARGNPGGIRPTGNRQVAGAEVWLRKKGYQRGTHVAAWKQKPRADIVIFPEGTEHKQENARVIVECKAGNVKSEDRKEGVGQLQSYLAACPNAAFGMWTNGKERFCYRRIVRDGNVTYEEVPDLPECGREDEAAEQPEVDQLKPAMSDALLFAFRRCHNYIAGNQGLQKPEAFWELLKLIFCKIYDERFSDEFQFYAAANERHGMNGPLKVKARLEKLFASVKADFSTIFKAGDATYPLNLNIRAIFSHLLK